ncbi:hypothetical protein TI04_00100 [Achromatium sp. WMS2]|nr:hypothetical protein TI04_00100 [Achromatium sp. WMS2]
MKRIWCALLLSALLVSCKLVQPVFNSRIDTAGGQVELSIIGIDEDTGQLATEVVEDDFNFLDQNWRVGGGGDLDLVNKLLPTGKAFAMPPSLLPLLGLGQRFATSSGGLFDPAIGAILNLWGFSSPHVGNHPVPPATAINALLYRHPKIRDLDQDWILLRSNNPFVQLNFTGLLHGYGVDLAASRLQELGINNAIIEFGAAIRVIGDKDGQPWRIFIHRPEGGGIFAALDVKGDEGIVTLGNHERNFISKRKHYHEILDPRTGFPATGSRAVTVIHNNAVSADAAAYAIFVAGPELWTKVAATMGIELAALLDAENVLHVTPAMHKRLILMDKYMNIKVSDPIAVPDAE